MAPAIWTVGSCPSGKGQHMLFINETETAELLSVSTRTLRRWRRERRIPFFQLPGGGVRYDRDALVEWLKQGCPKTQT